MKQRDRCCFSKWEFRIFDFESTALTQSKVFTLMTAHATVAIERESYLVR